MKKVFFSLSMTVVSLLANKSFFTNNIVGLKVSTLGLGIEYTAKYNDETYTRFGINGYTYSINSTKNDINFDIDLKLQTVTAIADYHPFYNTFRISGGLVFNNNKLKLSAKATQRIYTINNHTYDADEVVSLDGKIDFNSIVPYIGIGYINTRILKKWTLAADIGALYQGNPNTKLSVKCGAIANTTRCDKLKEDVLKEQIKLNNELYDLEWYPVIAFIASYKF
jgi:hypothetical protein